MLTKHIEINISTVCLSVVFRKTELMTVFVSGIHAHKEDTPEQTKAVFSIGYL